MDVIPIRQTDNPYYPLPVDYFGLDAEGARQARVNAARQWLVPAEWWPGSPEEQQLARVRAYLASVEFFDLWYLHPDHDARFDPQFYDSDPLPTPEMHRDILRLWATGRMNLCVMPRGSAKTGLTRKDTAMRLVTRPGYSIVYATSSHDNAKGTGQAVREQCYYNTRLAEDFGPEYGTTNLRPARGEAPTGVEYFYLANGSWLRCISAESKQRGLRPRRYRLDDPEFDAKASTSMTIRREGMESLLFKVVLPMVMREGCGVDWLATFVSRRHYAWLAMSKDNRGRALDARFDYWNRLLVDAIVEPTAENGLTAPQSCWPEMWPLTEADKAKQAETNPKARERMSLEHMERVMGTSRFNNEMRARPGETESSYWPDIHDAANAPRFDWNWSDPTGDDPRRSEAPITWHRRKADGTYELVSLPMREFLSRCLVFSTVDTSFTDKATSDFKACATMAYLPTHNELFVLDLFCEQCSEAKLISAAFRMSDRWKCSSINIEVVRQSKNLFETFRHHVFVRATEALSVTHTPAIRAIRVGIDSKSSRISGALDLRFEHGLVKLPLRHRHRRPWSHLFAQIEGFNPELSEDAGLDHDDALDVVSMSLYVVKGRRDPGAHDIPEGKDLLDQFADGDFTDDFGNNLAIGVPWDHVSPEAIAKILDASHARANAKAILPTDTPYAGTKA